jgi:hypothetical protein
MGDGWGGANEEPPLGGIIGGGPPGPPPTPPPGAPPIGCDPGSWPGVAPDGAPIKDCMPLPSATCAAWSVSAFCSCSQFMPPWV